MSFKSSKKQLLILKSILLINPTMQQKNKLHGQSSHRFTDCWIRNQIEMKRKQSWKSSHVHINIIRDNQQKSMFW